MTTATVTHSQSFGFWEDMGMYWAWRNSSNGNPYSESPTTKKIIYGIVDGVRQCVGFWDDDKYTSKVRNNG